MTVSVRKVVKTAPTETIGKVNLIFQLGTRTKLADTLPEVPLEASPPQTHDELDTAE